MKPSTAWLCAVVTAIALTGCNNSSSDPEPTPPVVIDPDPDPVELAPNILFVMMDDVGIDQLSVMGYGGVNPPETPSINAIAQAGVRFRNTWSMPECSPGRGALLAGTYPLRTKMYQALGPNDLANSQLSPYLQTVPKMLQEAGYESGLFGKFHLGGPEHNPFEYATPHMLGWDYFYGWLGGLPATIDTTAGGVGEQGTYSCGFVPSLAQNATVGADQGACYTSATQCSELTYSGTGDSVGLQCVLQGGILVPNASCAATAPEFVVFDRENAHYVSELVINDGAEVEQVPLADPRGRGYRSVIEAQAATEWINSRSGEQPWMATVSFSAPHTPLQPPPAELMVRDLHHELNAQCDLSAGNTLNARRIADAMIEGLDTALAQLMKETGIVTETEDGLVYNPDSRTMVVIVGDNGSFGPTVKAPFDLNRAKGTAYQTGVWVPLVVGGHLVDDPDRDVEHMVNATDVYGLFGEIAGLEADVIAMGGPDSMGLMPYLQDATQPSLRTYNFAQGALNIQLNDGRNGPCVFSTMCSHTPTSKSVCEDNGGVWWGIGADDSLVVQTYQSGDLAQCWEVNQVIYQADPAQYETNRLAMGPTLYQAIRNEHYKLVQNHALDYDPATDGPVDWFSIELYQINQDHVPLLDTANRDLLAGAGAAGVPDLTEEAQQNYAALSAAVADIMSSQPDCVGDGNYDGVVDQRDIDNYHAIVDAGWTASSWYDVNFDGSTDMDDLTIIEAALGTVCGL
ncbi:Arylsulfatase A [Pseudidiomarina indica]|uniref:Arylsulfatase A n=1 Tax=Pseudidiomarina indica TaxID=1159017 RepID=A0A1G6ANN9_9GAMM|nr:sulfatase-like hydrolase/transferase [Pseudidiomarina indica]SDB09965.1 Arylsulfatase A [Pseudidiomarina indica]